MLLCYLIICSNYIICSYNLLASSSLVADIYSQRFHVPCVDAWRCHGWPWLSECSGVVLSCFWLSECSGVALSCFWLSEFSGVALSCFTLSRWIIFPDVSLIKPEDSFNPLFKAVQFLVQCNDSGNLRWAGYPVIQADLSPVTELSLIHI